MAKAVPAAEFARNFGRYKLLAQRQAIPVSSNGTLAGYFVGSDEYEALQRLKSMHDAVSGPSGEDGADAAPAAKSGKALDPETKQAARLFIQKLRGKYPIVEAIVFGSRARQDHRPDSDLDIAVVLKGKRTKRFAVVQDLAGAAFDAMLETGVVVQALPLWEDDLKRPERFGNPAFIENIRRHGLRL